MIRVKDGGRGGKAHSLLGKDAFDFQIRFPYSFQSGFIEKTFLRISEIGIYGLKHFYHDGYISDVGAK